MLTRFMDGLIEFHFLQNALVTALVIGITCGAVGSFITGSSHLLYAGDSYFYRGPFLWFLGLFYDYLYQRKQSDKR